MKEYIVSLLSSALLCAVVGILTPSGEGGGIQKHMKLLISLFLVCVLIAPLKGAVEWVRDFANGEWQIPSDTEEGALPDDLQGALDESSKQYFLEMLTLTLEDRFEMESGTVRCSVEWENTGEHLSPRKITVFLSESSIWKDPHAIKDYLGELLSCQVQVAIE